MKERDWQEMTFAMLCKDSEGGEALRACFKEILSGEGRRRFVQFVSGKILKKMKLKQQMADKDGDTIFQVILWAYKAVKEFRCKEKEGAPVSNVGDMISLKRNLENNFGFSEGVEEIPKEELFKALVPDVYSKPELEKLLVTAAKMDSQNWFILCDNEKALLKID